MTVTADMIDLKPDAKGLLCMIVDDGQIRTRPFSECNMTKEKLAQILKDNKAQLDDIYMMLADKDGHYTIIYKEK